MKTSISEYNSVFAGNGLTYDDVLLLPGYSDFKRDDISLSTKLTKKVSLSIPFVSAPMDTVTEHKLAIALAKLGGLGIIHRNLTIKDQVVEIQKVKKLGLLVGAAVGCGSTYEKRVRAVVSAGADVIVADSAHGYSKGIIDLVLWIKKNLPQTEVIAGNIATKEGARALINAGADGLRVGMGPGAICTTRIISGMGVPQITALLETVSVAKKHNIPVIADGGIKYSGDMVKALAAGASSIMMGSFFASCIESPGQVVSLSKLQVPARFKSILSKNRAFYSFKSYRGMGSVGAMEKGAKIKSESEFHGKSYKEKVLVAEGVEGLVPIHGEVQDVVQQALGGIRSGMYYVGTKTIQELQTKGRFLKITQASLTESHPHDVLVTNGGKNYT